MATTINLNVDGVNYAITVAFDATTGGGIARTSSEIGYTVVPYDARGVSIPGTLAGADLAFREYARCFADVDSVGNPIASVEVREVEDSVGRLYHGFIRYEQPARDASTDVEFGVWPSSFTTTGGTARVTRSHNTRVYPINGPAPNFHSMIGWNGEEFEGLDAVVPAFSFELSRVTGEGFVSSFGEFANEISQYVGKVNAAPFMGFQPGNVLFNGVSSGTLQKQPATESSDAYNYWTLSYSFTAQPSTEINVSGVVVSKRGWDYVWYYREKELDPTTGVVVSGVRAAYVEEVYQAIDFAGLGLGFNY